MTRPIVPCLWFDDQAESAARFYTTTLPEGRVTATSRYPEGMDNPSGKPRGSVLTVEFEILGQRFTALNGGPQFTINPSISFFVHVESAADADRLFGTLAEGGDVLMPLDRYPWSERYGWAKDRFGVSWQVIAGPRPAEGDAIAPCLLFTDSQQGRAEEAMGVYTRAFSGGRIDAVDRYAAGEGPEGAVKYARFVLAGQDLVAMDSPVNHGFGFNEAVSFQVMCKDQTEVDHYWTTLAEGGAHGPCGWLKDRFGVSWQIVPEAMSRFLTHGDARARERAFAAMLGMKKLDIAAIEAAVSGA